MDDTGVSATGGPENDSVLNEVQPDQAGDGTFSIGPPQPIEDSRELPAVSAGAEADAVTGADLGDMHPDNVDVASPGPDAHAGEVLPGDDELAALVAGVDTDDVDNVGFEEGDDVDPLDDVKTLAARARMGSS